MAAVTAIQPKGTRPVGRTRMMGMARLALVAVAIILAYVAYLARSGNGEGALVQTTNVISLSSFDERRMAHVRSHTYTRCWSR